MQYLYHVLSLREPVFIRPAELSGIQQVLFITGDPAKLTEERKKISDFLFNSQELEGIQGKFKWVNGKKAAPYHFFQIRDNKLVKISVLVQK